MTSVTDNPKGKRPGGHSSRRTLTGNAPAADDLLPAIVPENDRARLATGRNAVIKCNCPTSAALGEAVADLLAQGKSFDDIAAMLKSLQTPIPPLPGQPMLPGFEPPPTEPQLPIFTTLPYGMIDVPSAARKYQIHRQTIHDWIRYGHLTAVGKLEGHSPGKSSHILMEADLIHHKNTRRPPGRPKKAR